MTNNANGDRIEYANCEELLSELRSYLEVPGNLEKTADYLFNSLVDEVALGVAFEIHHNAKTGKIHHSTFLPLCYHRHPHHSQV